jgi:hypothetical protein
MRRLSCFAALLFCVSVAAQGQTAVYGEVSASDYRLPNIPWKTGGTFGFYADSFGVPLLRAGIDVRASLIGSGNETLDSYLGGLRVQIHPHVLPLMPYGEALIGAAHVNVGEGIAHVDTTGEEYQLVGGADWTILPHVDWRVVDYSWGHLFNVGDAIHPQTLSTGLVVRMP